MCIRDRLQQEITKLQEYIHELPKQFHENKSSGWEQSGLSKNSATPLRNETSRIKNENKTPLSEGDFDSLEEQSSTPKDFTNNDHNNNKNDRSNTLYEGNEVELERLRLEETYKLEIEKLQMDIDDMVRLNQELKSELDIVSGKYDKLETDHFKLRTQRADLLRELNEKKNIIQDLESNLRRRASVKSEDHTEAAKLVVENETLRNEISSLKSKKNEDNRQERRFELENMMLRKQVESLMAHDQISQQENEYLRRRIETLEQELNRPKKTQIDDSKFVQENTDLKYKLMEAMERMNLMNRESQSKDLLIEQLRGEKQELLQSLDARKGQVSRDNMKIKDQLKRVKILNSLEDTLKNSNDLEAENNLLKERVRMLENHLASKEKGPANTTYQLSTPARRQTTKFPIVQLVKKTKFINSSSCRQ
eukprot:TRINITY_DN9032_c0_g1_i2.p1 TRINITY_DN9032_c0_g1~~TRINITY_DN9032_c0_g1_i2.p1  ORF type:complete len:422 (-),score=66.45 TRINITY_DN9032_c0_g1_i2:164-1429(-)